jgi:hypothetical protein
MQQIATSTIQRGIHERGPFVIPVRTVERVRIRMRLRRTRTDFVALYLGAGVAGAAFGFLLSLV